MGAHVRNKILEERELACAANERRSPVLDTRGVLGHDAADGARRNGFERVIYQAERGIAHQYFAGLRGVGQAAGRCDGAANTAYTD